MMVNLFSIFDPYSSVKLLNNWISSFTLFILLPKMFWLLHSRQLNLIYTLMSILNKEYITLLNKTTSFSIFLLALFLSIVLNNTMKLAPYIFTKTAHFKMTLTLAFPAWLTLMIFMWTKNTFHALAHCVPLGTPFLLMNFMVLIESISNLIRQITLSVWLEAKMIAGHLLLSLLGHQCPSSTSLTWPIIMISQIALITLESAVAIIQSYVFSVLMTLYISETN